MVSKDSRGSRAKYGSRVPVRVLLALASVAVVLTLRAQGEPEQGTRGYQGQTTQDYNRRLEELRRVLEPQRLPGRVDEYRIGPEDLLDITVFEAPELNRSERVSAAGEVSLPLLGAVHAAGLTPREMESVLQELLRRTYMKDPHVGVFVHEMQSHSVSVFGAVKKPGVFQIRGAKTVVELLSMAEGLAEDAGDTVRVMRGAARGVMASDPGEDSPNEPGRTGLRPAAPETAEIALKQLLDSGDPAWNVLVYPGDVVKVTRAGIVYVVGEVKKPGGYLLKSNENISVLQAIALAEGLTRTSAKGQARIIHTDEGTGQRSETPIDLGRILAGRAADPLLQPKDIVFVPNSSARSGFYRVGEATISTISGLLIFRR